MNAELAGMIDIAVESFPFDSKDQKEGFLALCHYWKKFNILPVLPLSSLENLTALFFIQKDYESNEYWRDLVATQIADLQNQIVRLAEDNASLSKNIDDIRELVKNQTMLLETLTRKP